MTIGSHQRSVGCSQVHLTPKWLLDHLGAFDLDPCAAPDPRPWPTARQHIAEPANGLAVAWEGRVWLNPPFDRYQIGWWINRMVKHNHGMVLLHARTETDWFRPIWRHATALLFLCQRIKFCRADGSEHPANSGAPVVLAAFGDRDASVLRHCGLPGAFMSAFILIEDR